MPECLPPTSLKIPVSACLPGFPVLQWAHGQNPENAKGPSRTVGKEQEVQGGNIKAGGGLSLMVLFKLTLSVTFLKSVIFIFKTQIILFLFKKKKSEGVAHQGPNFHLATIN